MLRSPKGLIERVEYDLGQALAATADGAGKCRSEFSPRGVGVRYSSLRCDLYFTDGSEPLVLYRYLDFT
jgi:hypothetical protein